MGEATYRSGNGLLPSFFVIGSCLDALVPDGLHFSIDREIYSLHLTCCMKIASLDTAHCHVQSSRSVRPYFSLFTSNVAHYHVSENTVNGRDT